MLETLVLLVSTPVEQDSWETWMGRRLSLNDLLYLSDFELQMYLLPVKK